MPLEALLFYALAALAVFSACAMVGFVRNAVAGVLSLVVTMICLSGVYILLEAHLVAVLQILLYAGAIVVLLLFVIMLLNLRFDDFAPPRQGQRALKAVAVGVVLGGFAAVLRVPFELPPAPELPAGFGGHKQMGVALFTDFVVPLEIAGLLLLAAIVGAVVLAKRRID